MPERGQVVLSFDFGSKYLGVAVGETSTGLCRPLETFCCPRREMRWRAVCELISAWQPHQLVVGLALDSDGSEQLASRQCRNFARSLQERTGLPTTLVDERYTSLEAAQLLRSQGMNARTCAHQEHAQAAALILNSYLAGLAA